MPSDAYAEIRHELEREKAELLRKLDVLGFGESTLDYDTNFADTSQVTAERGEVATLAQSLLDTKNDVDLALGKLNAGTYGTCENCGQGIDVARLEAKPTARLCINCANRA